MSVGLLSAAARAVGLKGLDALQQQRLDRKKITPLAVIGSSRAPEAADNSGLRQGLLESLSEQICQRGCRSVYRWLERVRLGESLEEIKGLSGEEISALVTELESVMAVYGKPCDLD